jgi:hypothetical protein
MLWNQYLQDTGHAIQRGLETGLHTLEGGLAFAGTLKGAYELGAAALPYVRAAVPALALL